MDKPQWGFNGSSRVRVARFGQARKLAYLCLNKAEDHEKRPLDHVAPTQSVGPGNFVMVSPNVIGQGVAGPLFFRTEGQY